MRLTSLLDEASRTSSTRSDVPRAAIARLYGVMVTTPDRPLSLDHTVCRILAAGLHMTDGRAATRSRAPWRFDTERTSPPPTCDRQSTPADGNADTTDCVSLPIASRI